MDPRDKIKVMEQLAAVENLVKLAASSNVKGIVSIERINGLERQWLRKSLQKFILFH